MVKKGIDKGEFVLLGVFFLFVVFFLYDISDLPLEGKLLSYIAAPFIILTAAFCLLEIMKGARKDEAAGKDRGEVSVTDPGEGREAAEKHSLADRRFYLTIGMGICLFVTIYLTGFYLGSGLTLLLWFVALNKLNGTTISITLGTPILFYVAFEVLLDMGLPQGMLWYWFSR